MEVECHSVEETQKFAFEFSKTIEMGSIISLNGGLGAGKLPLLKVLLEEWVLSNMLVHLHLNWSANILVKR